MNDVSKETARRWLDAVRQAKTEEEAVAKVHRMLCGYGLESCYRHILAEEIVALANHKEAA